MKQQAKLLWAVCLIVIIIGSIAFAEKKNNRPGRAAYEKLENQELTEQLAQLKDQDPEAFKQVMDSMRKREQRRDLKSDDCRRECPVIDQKNWRKDKKSEKGLKDKKRQSNPRNKRDKRSKSDNRRERKGRTINPEKLAEFNAWFEKNYPDQTKELKEIQAKDPVLYKKKEGIAYRKYGRILREEKKNPELAKILKKDIELKDTRSELVTKIKTSKDPQEIQTLTDELNDVLASRFDLIVERKKIAHQKLRQKLSDMEKEVEELENQVDKWKDPDIKKANVQERLENILGKNKNFKWN